jgi:hypothetical protein
LFWWREGAIEVSKGTPPGALPKSILTFALFDPEGRFRSARKREVRPEETTFGNSRKEENALGEGD